MSLKRQSKYYTRMFLAAYLTDVMFVVVDMRATAIEIKNQVACCGIDQGWQGLVGNKFGGSEQTQKRVLYHVFCVCSSTKTSADVGQQLVTLSNVLIGY